MIKRVVCNQYYIKQVLELLNEDRLISLTLVGNKLEGYELSYEESEKPLNNKSEKHEYNRLTLALKIRQFSRMLVAGYVDKVEIRYEPSDKILMVNVSYLDSPDENYRDVVVQNAIECLEQALESIQVLELEQYQIDKLYVRSGIRYKRASLEEVLSHTLAGVVNKSANK